MIVLIDTTTVLLYYTTVVVLLSTCLLFTVAVVLAYYCCTTLSYCSILLYNLCNSKSGPSIPLPAVSKVSVSRRTYLFSVEFNHNVRVGHAHRRTRRPRQAPCADHVNPKKRYLTTLDLDLVRPVGHNAWSFQAHGPRWNPDPARARSSHCLSNVGVVCCVQLHACPT